MLAATAGNCLHGEERSLSFRYETLLPHCLVAWCVMPNPVHVVIDISNRESLTKIVGSWKSFTAKRANGRLKRSGSFWHADYFDRYMRNEDHLTRTIEYVEENPVKAGLVAKASDWPWSSAHRTCEGGPEARGPKSSRNV